MIDVTLACEDANSKFVDVVTVADEDRVGNHLLKILELRYGQKAKLLFRAQVELQARFAAGVWPVFFC